MPNHGRHYPLRMHPARPSQNLRRSLAASGALVSALLLVTGCSLFSSSSKKTDEKEAAKKPELQCLRQGAERVETGNWRGDGKNDVVKVFVKSPEGGAKLALSCKEVDLNGDGRKDLLVYYDPLGRKQREEFDHDFDGVADLMAFYQEGQLVRQELDVNYDGLLDLVEHYENGRRVRVEKKLPSPRPEVRPDAKPDARPDAKSDAKPEAATDAKPEAATDARPETKPEAKPEAKPDAKPEPASSPSLPPPPSLPGPG